AGRCDLIAASYDPGRTFDSSAARVQDDPGDASGFLGRSGAGPRDTGNDGENDERVADTASWHGGLPWVPPLNAPRAKTGQGRLRRRQILLEERHGAVPRQLRRRLVVARRRVVVKAVLRARVHLDLVAHAGLLQ